MKNFQKYLPFAAILVCFIAFGLVFYFKPPKIEKGPAFPVAQTRGSLTVTFGHHTEVLDGIARENITLVMAPKFRRKMRNKITGWIIERYDPLFDLPDGSTLFQWPLDPVPKIRNGCIIGFAPRDGGSRNQNLQTPYCATEGIHLAKVLGRENREIQKFYFYAAIPENIFVFAEAGTK